MNDARVFERFARGKKKKNTATSRAQKLGRRSGEDQLKLASLSSGVEVALVVSASINWGKRCPHFLAETRPPFFATIRARTGKTSAYTRRTKKTLFAAAPLVTRTRRSGHRRRRRNREPSLRFRLRDGRRDASFFQRGKRETVRVRGDARVDARVFFFQLGFFFSRHARKKFREDATRGERRWSARRWTSPRRASDRARVHA